MSNLGSYVLYVGVGRWRVNSPFTGLNTHFTPHCRICALQNSDWWSTDIMCVTLLCFQSYLSCCITASKLQSHRGKCPQVWLHDQVKVWHVHLSVERKEKREGDRADRRERHGHIKNNARCVWMIKNNSLKLMETVNSSIIFIQGLRRWIIKEVVHWIIIVWE